MSVPVQRAESAVSDDSTTLGPGPASTAAYGRWTLGLILSVMLGQIAFLLVNCPWDFSGDEAEYWAWSRRLDWSYFSRGPLIAYLIRIATELAGPWSVRWTGSLMFAARLPAILLGGLTAWGVFRLGSLVTGSRRAGFLAALVLPAIPVFAIGGVLMTCDTPLVCCWTWAAVWAYRAIQTDDLRAWIAAGIVAALGVLAKYSLLALPASVALYVLLSPAHRRRLARSGFWVMSILCVVIGLAPIVAWNAQHGWAGAGQLADRVGISSRAAWGNLGAVLSFLGGEVVALGVIWWIVGIIALAGAIRGLVLASRSRQCSARGLASTHRAEDESGLLYVVCLWGVIWAACLAASVLGETEINWMVPGYVAIVILIGRRIDEVIIRSRARAWTYGLAWCLSVAGVVVIHHTDWLYRSLARWVPAPTKQRAAPLRYLDVTARLRGHRELARAVHTRIEELSAQGASPFVLTPTYALTATLSFHLPGQPETYCLSWNYGMTHHPVNQHDLWHPNPRHDPHVFRGRPVVVVEDANMPPNYSLRLADKGVVGRTEPVERVVVRDRGVIVGAWDITVCHDYRGLAGYVQSPPIQPAVAASATSNSNGASSTESRLVSFGW